MTYRIMGRYQGQTEELDSFDTQLEAERMLEDYQLAFRGQGWSLWWEKTGEENDSVSSTD